MVALLSQKSKSLGLFPDVEPDAYVVDDDVEKEEIAEHSCDQGREDEIDDAVPLSLGLIERTHPLPSEIEHDAPR